MQTTQKSPLLNKVRNRLEKLKIGLKSDIKMTRIAPNRNGRASTPNSCDILPPSPVYNKSNADTKKLMIYEIATA